MSWLSLSLVVLAALLHASWNIASKRAASAGVGFVFAYRLWSALIYLPWVAYIFYIDGMPWSWLTVAFIALSTVFHLAYSLSLMRGYQAADLSVVYPVARGTGPLFASILAVIWLGESLYWPKFVGILAVVLGILLIATQGRWRHFLSPASWVGIRWGLIIGAMIASYSLADAYGVKVLLIAPVVLDWASSLGGAVLLLPRVWTDRVRLRQRMAGKWWIALYVGAVSPMAYILVLYALQLGAEVSQVAPLREMSMIAATVVGSVFLKEKVGIGRWIGCLTILIGVVMIASS